MPSIAIDPGLLNHVTTVMKGTTTTFTAYVQSPGVYPANVNLGPTHAATPSPGLINHMNNIQALVSRPYRI